MSHHHHDEETGMDGTLNGNNIPSRRHTHAHLHLKPTVVFDHIKTKVKRKRHSNNGLQELPAFAVNNNINGNNIPQRLSQEDNELDLRQSLIATNSQPTTSTRELADQRSDGSDENKTKEENNLSIEKEENNSILSNNHIDKDENINEIDIENNQKTTKVKLKVNKLSKSLSESTNQSNIKKRRQTVRRTAFQIRDEDFNNIFNDLPSDEQLIIGYPCAWRKDIFMHGRLFLSVNYLCFYTCFFKWQESVCIAYKDIVSVTREKSAKLVPNGIQLKTKNREQYLFASYTPRERIFIAIFRLWQNSLLEKPLDYQQLRTIVYADQMSIDESTGDSQESIVLENNEEHFPNRHSHSHSLPQIPLNHLRELSSSFIQSDEGIVSPSPAEQTTYLSTCPCETHLARTYADRLFSYHVNQLFELIFGDNSFTRTFHESQKLTDYTIDEWHRNTETGKRERQVTYKTITQSILGTNTISCTEKQTIEVAKPHSMYVVNTEVYNEGMKYTDTFFVATRFCMFQCDAKHSSLRISAEVRYVKSVNGIAKAFIEKNCNASIEDGINNQIKQLENHQEKIHKHHSNKKQTSVSKQRTRKKKGDGTNPDEENDISISNSSETQPLINQKTITGKGFFFDMALFIGIFLLLLHIYLCYKLRSLDQALQSPDDTCLNQCKQACLKNKIHQ